MCTSHMGSISLHWLLYIQLKFLIILLTYSLRLVPLLVSRPSLTVLMLDVVFFLARRTIFLIKVFMDGTVPCIISNDEG